MSDHSASAWAALLLRVANGLGFLAYGLLLKVFVYTPAGTAAYFESIGYPAVLGYAVIAAEVAGGVMLLAGLWSRWVALALIPVLLGAALEHAPNGWVFSAPGGGWSYPVFWAATLGVQALLGDGALSLREAVRRAASASLGRQAHA